MKIFTLELFNEQGEWVEASITFPSVSQALYYAGNVGGYRTSNGIRILEKTANAKKAKVGNTDTHTVEVTTPKNEASEIKTSEVKAPNVETPKPEAPAEKKAGRPAKVEKKEEAN